MIGGEGIAGGGGGLVQRGVQALEKEIVRDSHTGR